MKSRIVMQQNSDTNYSSKCGLKLTRGMLLPGDNDKVSWILSDSKDVIIDRGAFRNDIADAHNLLLRSIGD